MIWPDDFINKIICGDCLEVMREMPDECVNLINADPPFRFSSGAGVGFISREKKQHIKRVMKFSSAYFDPTNCLEASRRLMRKYNSYWWGNKSLVNVYLNFANHYNYLFDILTWHKANPVPIFNNHHLNDTEYCILIREKGSCFNSNLEIGKYKKYYISFLGSKVGQKAMGHPSVKPLELIKIQIELSSEKGSLILDPYLGSGTTAVACRQLKRNFIGIEINPDYCKIAEERLAQGVL